MAYYYVKSGLGTRTTGGAGTQQTGAFGSTGLLAADVYASISACLTANTLSSGDFICCSSSHSHAYSGTTTLTMPTGVVVVSVLDSSADTYTAGALEDTSSGNLTIFGTEGDSTVFYGVSLGTEDDLIFGNQGTRHVIIDATIGGGTQGVAATSNNITPSAYDGVVIELHDVTLSPTDAVNSYPFEFTYGFQVEMYGGSVDGALTNAPTYLAKVVGNAGGRLFARGTDFSNMSSTMELLDVGTASVDDTCEVELYSCKMPANWSLTEAPASGGTKYVLENCSSANRAIRAGRDIIGQFITSTAAYDSAADTVDGESISVEVQTTAKATQFTPFRFKLGAVHADFSTSKTITVQLAHDSQGSGTSSYFTDAEAWIEVHRPNSADAGVLVETSGVDPFATASSHTDSAQTWTVPTMTTELNESLTLDTTATGGTGWADVYVCIGVASIGAADLFVSHDIEVA